MYKFRQRVRKFVTFVALLSVLGQSFTPFLYALPTAAYAQEVTTTPTDTPAPTDSVTPTPPADSVTPTPDTSVTPTDTPAPVDTVTPTPVDTVTPTDTSTPTDTATPPADNSSQNNNNSNQPSSTPTDTAAPTASASLTDTPAVSEKTGYENVSFAILKNVLAPSLDLQAANTQNSATLSTDKLDYAPTDAAVITGTGLFPKTTYILYVSSTDPPAVNFSTQITTSDQGTFIYAYQLDGTYRPNYSVELKDAAGVVVASTTFTDSPVTGCTPDAQGANDQPNQKDLTEMCVNTATSTALGISWNWDDTSFSGKNTGDACSLYDTNNNSFADYALCVGVNGDPATMVYTTLYSCGDSSSEKCTQPIVQINNPTSSCTAAVGTGVTIPFNSGQDTIATCNVNLNDVGGGSANLLDVCSFPSGQPNSDPSDCIIASTAAQTGTLTVVKSLIPTSDAGKFDLLINSIDLINDVGNGGTTGPKIVTSGSNTFGEAAGTSMSLSNYSTTVACKDNSNNNTIATTGGPNPWTVNVGNNQNVTCTITNTRINNGSIALDKVTNPSQDPTSFSFTTTNLPAPTSPSLTDTATPVTWSSLSAGTYTITEPGVSGWTLSSKNCTGSTSSVITPITNGVSVSLAAGENVTCTFTNTKQATLTIHKDVINHGGNKTTANFAPYQVGTTTVSLDQANVFSIGSHTVTETPDANYTATFSGACDVSGNVTLAAGDDKTCTITNEEKSAKVVVHKIVINHGLTNDATHFAPYKVGTTTVVLDSETVINSGSYVVSEAADSNYTATFTAGDCDANGNITLVAGQTKSCTITNEENATHLKLTKVVKNHGGTKIVSDFPLLIDGNSVTSGTNNLVNSGAHIVSETRDLNYTAAITGNCDSSGNVTLAPGDNGECTITNEEKLSDITVHKVVLSHGGNKTTASFAPYQVDATTVSLDQATTFDSGNHTVTETPDSKYAATFSGDCNSNGVVALGSGDHKTCTITNEEKPAKLIVTKIVVDDNGGTKVVSDFSLFVGATGVTSGATNTFDSGAYVVSETNDSNYAGSFTAGDCDASGNVTLVAGQTKSCTITNNDIAPTLTVNKVLVPADDTGLFNLQVDGSTAGTGSNVGNNGTTGAVAVTAGVEHTVGEVAGTGTDLTNYTAVISGDCASNGTITLRLAENKSCTITNTRKGTVIVTKYLDDNANGTQDIFEGVLGGWRIDLTGSTFQVTDNTTGQVTFADVLPVTHTLSEVIPAGWTQSNISCSSDVSLDIINVASLLLNNLASSNSHDITVTPGGTVICSIGNYQNGNIIFKKIVNGPGGEDVTDTSTHFGFNIGAAQVTSLTDDETSDPNSVKPGTYTVGETPNSNYDFQGCSAEYSGNSVGTQTSNGEIITVNSGDTVTVTCTNNQKTGNITGMKWSDINGNGQNDEEPGLSGWTIFVDANGNGVLDNGEYSTTTDSNGNYTLSGLNPDTYRVCEVQQDDWTQTYPADSELHNCQDVTISSNQTARGANFGNQEKGKLQVIKYNDLNGNGIRDEGEETLSGWDINLTQGEDTQTQTTNGGGVVNFNNLTPGGYVLGETIQNGWEQTNISCTTQGEPTPTPTVTETPTPTPTGIEGTPTPIPTGEPASSHNLCHKTSSAAHPWNAIAVPANNHTHDGHVNDFAYNGLVDKNGHPQGGGVGEAWCADNAPQAVTMVPHTNLLDKILGMFVGIVHAAEAVLIIDNSNHHDVTVGAGQLVKCEIGNHNLIPILTISKSNDAAGDKAPGDTVGFTLTIEATQSAAQNVTVTDLLPQGFHFNDGSWKVVSSIHGDITGSLTAPTYHSPGVWTLGNLANGETLTLTYAANIDGGEPSGTYYDNAWGQGESLSSEKVLANALPTGFVDTNFVGTQVAVVTGIQSGGDYNVTSTQTQSVLGASTEMPATGENTIWVIIATLLMGLGLGSLILGVTLRRKYVE